jgi:tRNA (guanine-N7-)-methyltransferase
MKKSSDLRIPFTWDERRSVVLDRFLYIPGHFDGHGNWECIPWNDARLFGNERPVTVEYCSGNGQWICERAKQYPNINWVAVEKRFDRARKIWARLHREALPNLFVVCGDALVYTRHYVPHHSVSQFFVNFPDPWPKLRHAKHRLIRPEFLRDVEKIAIPQANAIFTTDDPPCAAEMLAALAACPAWRSVFPAPHYKTEWPDYGISFFSNLWTAKGRVIHYIQFEVNG